MHLNFILFYFFGNLKSSLIIMTGPGLQSQTDLGSRPGGAAHEPGGNRETLHLLVEGG